MCILFYSSKLGSWPLLTFLSNAFMQTEARDLCTITGKGATLHRVSILRLNVPNLLHRLSACLKDNLASFQSSSPMSGSWFPNLAALWKAINGHPCPWTLGSKSLVRAVSLGRSASRVWIWIQYCLHAASLWCMFRCFPEQQCLWDGLLGV